MAETTPTPAPGPGANLEKQTLEALKAIGKALGQMALYKVGHPAVIATIATAHENLTAALALSSSGELAVGIDQDKLILNARVVGSLSQLPAALANLFKRFKLTSLSFKTGLSADELVAFCELAAMRPDSPAAADPKGWLAGRSVFNIVFNAAVYLKAGDKAAGPGAGAGAGGGGPAGAGEGPGAGEGAGAGDGGAAAAQAAIQGISDAIATGSLERTMMALVEKAVPDPVLRKKVIEQVMKLLEVDIAKRVEEVTVPLKREKKTLENEAKRTDSVLGSMVEGVVVVDDQGKILMMNPAAEQIYGQTLAQSAGKPLSDKPSEQFIVTMANELTTPADRDIAADVKLQGAADTQRTLRASSAVVKTEEGKVVGMVSALPDATKHKELQRMQRDFVAHVTHELRAPLSSIRAALEILQGQFASKIEEDETRMLNTALKNSDRLAEMINSILDFSKIESGQMEVFTKPTEAAKIAQDAVDSLQPWAQKKRISLSLSAPEGLPLVQSDASRTVQVIVNLLSNAIKFTPAGGSIKVTVAKRAEGNQGFVEYSVKDTGPGIPKSEQAKVFEKFVQIAAGETHVGGTGLGLSIAKALVHLQKGKMWIESEAGQGADFKFTLPVHVAESVEASYVRTKAPPPKPAPWWKKLLGLK
ncbi:MAG: PAS domain S-box protein [Elusimicrobia bacterium]|nr:PAS domain S-box protein [Elusimicrobiota bacterium]